jgi:hypothetical protein
MPTAKRARAPETSAIDDDTAGNNNNNARKSSATKVKTAQPPLPGDNNIAEQQQAKCSQYSLNAAAAMGTAITIDEPPMDTIIPAHNNAVPTHQQHYYPAAAPPAPYIQPIQGHDQVLHDQRRMQQQQQQ